MPAQAETGTHDRFKRVAHFIQWGVYGRDYHVKDMDTSGAAAKLTHINYAFGFVNPEGACYSADPWADWQRPVPAEQSVDGVADEPGQALNGNLFTDRRDPNEVRYSVDRTVRDYRERGAPARKLVIGVPAYGQGWTGVTAGNGLYKPATGPAPGTWAAGTEDYKDLVAKPGKRHRDQRTGTMWLYDGNEFWSYDDPAVLVQKAAYIRLKRLGGAMMWSIDQDDSRASLTSALHAVLR